ncbi:uncharacterized protein PITG_12935 [Phytophthora infestans T30-4]|uniref:Uncharacterized protein n=2 Tax=Phytophthora infestans TaxID=4787 RepID=D0NJW8_PHYIT|nr:uncharacterized protein PITG_12935 [Phytophthora infestans T30-4]EEY59805.1 conserved hypothetical protein [Phytophthora infestans T30-4]KAF4039439.1 hypothetical protein GN244_ATG08270 [Phytophthora infestans]KAI9981478.1 hypothetical protein PInf_009230 [Phytophthora infestans]|eukprot:XP_002900490.1 conserved hypothetical protein [Phytophthora infestans T30-4]
MEENAPLSLPSAQQTDQENLTVGGSLVQPAGPARKNFMTADDLISLRAVNTIKPGESAMNKGNPEKYVYLNSRLQFEKYETKRMREHELKLEQQRQEAERARDERMQAAERDFEKFMLQLLEIALGRAKDKQ